MTRTEALIVAAGASYLVALGIAMQYTSYDVWGALMIAPFLVLASGPLINRAFRGRLIPLRKWAWAGLAAKLVGAIAGYAVRVGAYGTGDALRYDLAGKQIAGDVWSGSLGLLEAIPTSTGTEFVEQFTGLVYVFTGSSRLGGFLVFTWFSYVGLLLFVKAAAIAVHGVDVKRYAMLLFFFPSLIYWGSSIGKEAFLGLALGLGSYGAALLLREHRRPLRASVYLVLGVGAAALVRPHFAALLAGGAALAMVVRLAVDLTRRTRSAGGGGFAFGSFVLAGVAVVGFVFVADFALDYFAPIGSDGDHAVGDQFSQIYTEVARRTSEGGSNFIPPTVNGPTDFPYAAGRTLTRPLPNEARSVAELLPALEMTGLFVLAVAWRRRLFHAPKLIVTTPYVAYAFLCTFTFGVAFSSIGNTGLLVRQRSLILPLLLLFWCLPPIPARESSESRRERARAEFEQRRRTLVGAGR